MRSNWPGTGTPTPTWPAPPASRICWERFGNRLSFSEIISRRDELIKAFTDNATSDISSGAQILELIRLLFESKDARVVEVKFPATLGPSYVTATQPEIDAAVDKFLGFKDSAGPIGTLDEGEGSQARAKKRKERSVRKKAKKQSRTAAGSTTKAPSKENDGLVDAAQGGMDLAAQLYEEFTVHNLPIFYTKRLPEGTIYPEGSRAYHLRDLDKNPHKAYRMVMVLESNGLHYFGLQGIQGWTNPPILSRLMTRSRWTDETSASTPRGIGSASCPGSTRATLIGFPTRSC